MKKIGLVLISLFMCVGCCVSSTNETNDSIIVQYQVVDNTDTTTNVLYTFTDSVLYIDEIGNEGFGYPYKVVGDSLYIYDIIGDSWECGIISKVGNDNTLIRIKFNEEEITLRSMENIVAI